MKVLPSYLIEYMPYIEDAIEELKLSVYDHAYDLLKALDVDELTSDEIRQKLELYDIKVENMSESWLPNGRFYRIYPSIRYNRTRLNDLQSVVKSGGQFEGLWSNDFNTKTEYNYRYIQMMRHYTAGSPVDGYFYISGDTSITDTGVVSDSTITALSSDIFIDQAMPAGYTYLYVPWPMPHYPTDAGSFYNPHMLMADRLHYTSYTSDDSISQIEDVIDNISSASLPASSTYDWSSGINTPYKLPYWHDYHYMGEMSHSDINNNSWPIKESGVYYDKDGAIVEGQDLDKATLYKLNDTCIELSHSNSVFPTECWSVLTTMSTQPDRNAESEIVHFEYNKLADEDFTVYDSIDMSYPGASEDEFGPYRVDSLSHNCYNLNEILGHIQTKYPFWADSTVPIYSLFNMYLPGQDSTIENRKLYYWMKFVLGDSDFISIEEYTDYTNPTIFIKSESYSIYTRAADDSQGSNKSISNTVGDNALYPLGESSAGGFDQSLSYSIVNLGYTEGEDESQQIMGADNCYLEGDPTSGILYLNRNGSYPVTSLNYVTYETSNVHKLWFSSSKENVTINSAFTKLYNDNGNDEIYYHGSDNLYSFSYNIIGLYNSDGSLADYNLDGYEFNCYLANNSNYNVLLRVIPITETNTIEYDTNSSQWELADNNDPIPSGVDTSEYTIFKGKLEPTVEEITTTLTFDLSPDSDSDKKWFGRYGNNGTDAWHAYNYGWFTPPVTSTYPALPSGTTWKIFESSTVLNSYDNYSVGTDTIVVHEKCAGFEISTDNIVVSTSLSFKICSSTEGSGWDPIIVLLNNGTGNDTVIEKISGVATSWTDVNINLSAGHRYTIKVLYVRDSSNGAANGAPNCGWMAIDESIYNSGSISVTSITPNTATLDINFNIETENDLEFPFKISHTGSNSSEHTNVYINNGTSPSYASTKDTWTSINDISLSRGTNTIAVKYDKCEENPDDYGFIAIPNNLINTSTMNKEIVHSYTPSVQSFSAAYILFTVSLAGGPIESISYQTVSIGNTVPIKIAYGLKLYNTNSTITKAVRFDLGNIEFHSSNE